MSVHLILLGGGYPVANFLADPPIEEWTLGPRRKLRKYVCSLCGSQYWQDQVVVQTGLIRCCGPETKNCIDQPGYQAFRRRIQLPIERPNPALPVSDEEL